MPIQTATPEQVEQCVLGLKRTVDSQAATIERQAAEIERLRGVVETVLMIASTDAGWYSASKDLAHIERIARDALREPDHDPR